MNELDHIRETLRLKRQQQSKSSDRWSKEAIAKSTLELSLPPTKGKPNVINNVNINIDKSNNDSNVNIPELDIRSSSNRDLIGNNNVNVNKLTENSANISTEQLFDDANTTVSVCASKTASTISKPILSVSHKSKTASQKVETASSKKPNLRNRKTKTSFEDVPSIGKGKRKSRN